MGHFGTLAERLATAQNYSSTGIAVTNLAGFWVTDVRTVEQRLLFAMTNDRVKSEPINEGLDRRGFFPITFPLTTGPGTIAASFALGAQIPATLVLYLAGVVVAASGAMLVSLVLYTIFGNSTAVVAWLGDVGMLVLMRLMAFILLCIGLQIMWYGWAELNSISSVALQ